MSAELQEAFDEFDEAFTASSVAVSPQVAAFLVAVLNSIQLPVAAADFEAQAALIVQAKRELEAAPRPS